jgi:hypothetical protein
LKEVALAGSSGSKAMKRVPQQILNIAVKATGEGSQNSNGHQLIVALHKCTSQSDQQCFLQVALNCLGKQVTFLFGV